jgi:hypothetical protein
MFAAFDLSSYGKGDVLPASLSLFMGLLWATYVPYQGSEKHGLHPFLSAIRAVTVWFATIAAFTARDNGHPQIASLIFVFFFGVAVSPNFVVSPPIGATEQPNFVLRLAENVGQKFLDSKFASLLILALGSLLSLLVSFNSALSLTMAVVAVLSFGKIGKAHEGAEGGIRKFDLRIFGLGIVGTACTSVFLLAFNGLSRNFFELKLPDLMSFLAIVGGMAVGAIF